MNPIKGKCFHCGRKIEDGATICRACSEKAERLSLEIAVKNFADGHELTLKELSKIAGELDRRYA